MASKVVNILTSFTRLYGWGGRNRTYILGFKPNILPIDHTPRNKGAIQPPIKHQTTAETVAAGSAIITAASGLKAPKPAAIFTAIK